MPKLKPLSRQFMSYNFCKSTGNWSLKYRAGKTVNLTNNSVLDMTPIPAELMSAALRMYGS